MLKFIGNSIDGATHDLEDNDRSVFNGLTRLTHAQACLMPVKTIHTSLDTTDKGSRGTRAKRWYRFFADPKDVLSEVRAMDNMRDRANVTRRAS